MISPFFSDFQLQDQAAYLYNTTDEMELLCFNIHVLDINQTYDVIVGAHLCGQAEWLDFFFFLVVLLLVLSKI